MLFSYILCSNLCLMFSDYINSLSLLFTWLPHNRFMISLWMYLFFRKCYVLLMFILMLLFIFLFFCSCFCVHVLCCSVVHFNVVTVFGSVVHVYLVSLLFLHCVIWCFVLWFMCCLYDIFVLYFFCCVLVHELRFVICLLNVCILFMRVVLCSRFCFVRNVIFHGLCVFFMLYSSYFPV